MFRRTHSRFDRNELVKIEDLKIEKIEARKPMNKLSLWFRVFFAVERINRRCEIDPQPLRAKWPSF